MGKWFIGVILLSLFVVFYMENQKDYVSLDEFVIQDGYEISLVAAEPLIEAPVAIDWDNKGRLWVLEMPDYMPDIDGVTEDIPRGRVVILEDTKGDGQMDRSIPFLEKLSQPRAIKLINGGLLYAESPNLWFVDIVNDKPGKRILVDSLFATGGNVEHKANGLLYNIDNWIYNAKSNYRYRYKAGEWIKEPTAFRGQWGITHDQWGYIYANDNSNGLYGDFVLPGTASSHPYFTSKNSYNKDVLGNRAIFPLHATSVNRGYTKDMLDEEGKPKYMTSTCGPHISQGQVDPGNGFICVPEGNIIKQVSVQREKGNLKATYVYEDEEFLASTDETFRPVNINTGTDGALYVTDFHRGVIQHRVYMTAYLRELLVEKGLHEAVGMGRIWKIQKLGKEYNELINFKIQSISSLVGFLSDSNGAIRMKAQQELIERGNEQTLSIIQQEILGATDFGKLHMLYVIEAMDSGLLDSIIKSITKQTLPNQLIAHLIKLTEENRETQSLIQIVEKYINKEIPEIDRQISHSLGTALSSYPEKASQLYNIILERYPADKVTAEMLISGLNGNEELFRKKVLLDSYPIYKDAFAQLIENINQGKLAAIHEPPQPRGTDGRTAGRELFAVHCAACHGKDGLGISGLAPSLANASIINSGIKHVALTLFTGLTGPVSIDGKMEEYNAAMPGLLSNPNLTDQDIANISGYISNAFSKKPSSISVEEVSEIRKAAATFETMPTEEEILSF